MRKKIEVNGAFCVQAKAILTEAASDAGAGCSYRLTDTHHGGVPQHRQQYNHEQPPLSSQDGSVTSRQTASDSGKNNKIGNNGLLSEAESGPSSRWPRGNRRTSTESRDSRVSNRGRKTKAGSAKRRHRYSGSGNSSIMDDTADVGGSSMLGGNRQRQ